MRVISRKRLKQFAAAHADAEPALDTWYRVAHSGNWASIDDVRKTFPHADFVDPYTVFNVKGNKYRLIVVIRYPYRTIFIRSVMTHAEYDKGRWR